MTATPQSIRVEATDVKYDIDGHSLLEAAAALTATHHQLTAQGYSNFRIDIDTTSDYSGGEYAVVKLMADRMETQDQADARAERELLYKAGLERQERKQYEALKAKYG